MGALERALVSPSDVGRAQTPRSAQNRFCPRGFCDCARFTREGAGAREGPGWSRASRSGRPFTPPSLCGLARGPRRPQPGPQRFGAATPSPPGLEITRDLILPGLHPQELFKGIFSSRDQPGRPPVGVAGCCFSAAVGQGRASSRNPPPTAGEKAQQRAEAESKQMRPLPIQSSQRLPGRACAPTARRPHLQPRDTELGAGYSVKTGQIRAPSPQPWIGWRVPGRPHLPLGWGVLCE